MTVVSHHRNPNHDSFFIPGAPGGMRDRFFYQKGLVLMYGDFFIAQQYFGFTLDDDEQMAVLMRMLFRRASAFHGHVGYRAVDNLPHAAEQFFGFEVDMLGRSRKSIFQNLGSLS